MSVIVYDPAGNAYALTLDSSGHLVATPTTGGPTLPTVGPSGIVGWTVTDIIKQVMGRTENRASGKPNFDLRMEFFLGLDEFVQERHYWWRRKMFAFQTIIGQASYDLSQLGTGNAPDLSEIEEIFVVNAAPQFWPYSVTPEFTAREQVAAIYGQQQVGQLIPKSGYFLTPGAFQLLTLSQPPNQVYTIAGTYYAVPMVTDTTQETIPLVPPNLTFGLIYMYQRRIMEFLSGQDDPRWGMIEKRYQDFLKTAAKVKSFSQQLAIHSSSSEGAIHAGGGRGVYRGSGGSDR
jgi:hypothetical protein